MRRGGAPAVHASAGNSPIAFHRGGKCQRSGTDHHPGPHKGTVGQSTVESAASPAGQRHRGRGLPPGRPRPVAHQMAARTGTPDTRCRLAVRRRRYTGAVPPPASPHQNEAISPESDSRPRRRYRDCLFDKQIVHSASSTETRLPEKQRPGRLQRRLVMFHAATHSYASARATRREGSV